MSKNKKFVRHEGYYRIDWDKDKRQAVFTKNPDGMGGHIVASSQDGDVILILPEKSKSE